MHDDKTREDLTEAELKHCEWAWKFFKHNSILYKVIPIKEKRYMCQVLANELYYRTAPWNGCVSVECLKEMKNNVEFEGITEHLHGRKSLAGEIFENICSGVMITLDEYIQFWLQHGGFALTTKHENNRVKSYQQTCDPEESYQKAEIKLIQIKKEHRIKNTIAKKFRVPLVLNEYITENGYIDITSLLLVNSAMHSRTTLWKWWE